MLKRTSILGLLSLLIALILTTVLFSDGLPFRDVPPGAWYFNDVKTAFDTGLINGKSDTQFAPDDNMTAAEAVKLAACMHQLKNTGAVTLVADGKPWYKPYVDYAKENNIIAEDLPWNENINRAGYMQIFAQLITDAEAGLNDVPDNSIPDVRMTYPNAEAIYKLYRAGVVQGVNAERYSNLYSYIKRSEVAAILTRMMNADKRIKMEAAEEAGEFKITKEPGDAKAALGTRVDLICEVRGGREPISYQWQYYDEGSSSYKNSTSEGNRTNRLKAPVEDEAYEYRCVIEDGAGKVLTTRKAKVEQIGVEGPLTITKHPKPRIANLGAVVEVEVRVTGGKAPITYQWEYADDVNGPYFYISSGADRNKQEIIVEDRPFYVRCIVRDASGTSLESARVLVAKGGEAPSDALRITKQPADMIEKQGEAVIFGVELSGGKAPYSYQWRYSDNPRTNFLDSRAEGNKTNRLKVGPESKTYYYVCFVRDSEGREVVSEPVRVVGRGQPLHIRSAQHNYLRETGERVPLSVVAEGGQKPYTYQWQILDAYTFENMTQEGSNTKKMFVKVGREYDFYRCIVRDARGEMCISPTLMVMAKEEPFLGGIVKQPEGKKAKVGETVDLVVEISPEIKDYRMQWCYIEYGSNKYRLSGAGGSNTNRLRVKVEETIYDYQCIIVERRDSRDYCVHRTIPVRVEKKQ